MSQVRLDQENQHRNIPVTHPYCGKKPMTLCAKFIINKQFIARLDRSRGNRMEKIFNY